MEWNQDSSGWLKLATEDEESRCWPISISKSLKRLQLKTIVITHNRDFGIPPILEVYLQRESLLLCFKILNSVATALLGVLSKLQTVAKHFLLEKKQVVAIIRL